MPHLELNPLADTPFLQVIDVCCRAPQSGWSAEEYAALPRLVIPRRGLFGWQAHGERHLVEAGCVLLLEPEVPYRFSHPVDGGDDCTLIRLAPDLWQEAAGARRPQRRFARLSPVEQYWCALFHRAATRCAEDRLALEELGLQLASTLLDALNGPPSRKASSSRPRAAARHRRLAEAALAHVAANYRRRDGLDTISRRLNSSPFHLARVFRAQTGITIHQYRGRLRLAAALTALGEGCDDLTALALRLGYASHSHFSEAFRAAYGCSPSVARASLTRGTVAEMRKILEAGPSARPYAQHAVGSLVRC